MSELRPPEPDPPARAVDDVEEEPAPTRPTVDEMSEWSFPASDPPATWTWDIRRPQPRSGSESMSRRKPASTAG
jgi:hypothetical protein